MVAAKVQHLQHSNGRSERKSLKSFLWELCEQFAESESGDERLPLKPPLLKKRLKWNRSRLDTRLKST